MIIVLSQHTSTMLVTVISEVFSSESSCSGRDSAARTVFHLSLALFFLSYNSVCLAGFAGGAGWKGVLESVHSVTVTVTVTGAPGLRRHCPLWGLRWDTGWKSVWDWLFIFLSNVLLRLNTPCPWPWPWIVPVTSLRPSRAAWLCMFL